MAERYEIKGKLARGGIGAIYRAHDRSLSRDVAIKRLLPIEETKLNESAAHTLSREASALAKFAHPNVVTLYSFEIDEEGPFVVTELIDGENLKETTENAALSIKDFKQLVEQTLDPLITAQDMGLLHRDIKPSNIMVTMLASGRFQIKILDFGLAKFSQTPSTQTLDQKGSFLGSIEYLAPEQLELKPLDQRTDLYSLGCVYYYTLTQTAPFQGANAAETMDNHLEGRVEDIRKYRKDVPVPLAAWLMKLIKRNPEDRPKNAREAMDGFYAALEGEMPGEANQGPLVSEAEISEPVEPFHDPGPMMGNGSSHPKHQAASNPIKVQTGWQSGKTAGQRLLEQKNMQAVSQATGLKVPILALIGVTVLTATIFALLSRGGDDDDISPPPPIKETNPNAIPERLPENSIARNVVRPPFFAKTLPFENSLVAHYAASDGTFSEDLATSAKSGQRVIAWQNIAPGVSERHLLRFTQDSNATPILKPIGTATSINSHPFLEFPPGTMLSTRSTNDILKLFEQNEVTTFAVIKISSNVPGIVMRFDSPKTYGLLALRRLDGGLGYATRSATSKQDWHYAETESLGWSILCQQWSEKDQLATLTVQYPKGHRKELVRFKPNKLGETISRYQLGSMDRQEARATPFALAELAIYNRMLNGAEIDSIFAHISKKYFQVGK